MRVILTDNYEGLGKKGEIINVRDGFGRNYLIPKGFAIPATDSNLKRLEHLMKEIERKKLRKKRHSEEIKEILERATLVVEKRVGKDGKLFGSVTQKDIADAIEKNLKIKLDKRDIIIEEPIKTQGIHTVYVDLGESLKAKVTLSVEKKE